MKTTNEWVCGNVAVTATLELPDDTLKGVAALATAGLTQILQRKPSSKWEKEEAGYEKRPAGFQRDSIPYSDESAKKLTQYFLAAVPTGIDVSFETARHTGGAAVPTKEATDLWTMVCKLEDEALETALENLGLDNTTDEVAGVEACKKTLQKAKADAAAKAKAALGL